MHGGQDRDRLARGVDAREYLRRLGDAGQPLPEHLGPEMLQVQEDVVPIVADPAPFADLDGHGAADDVARGEVLRVGSVALHEPLAVGVGQIAAFAPRTFGHQAAGAVDPGRVELDELHVLQGQAGSKHHRVAIAGAGVGGGAREVGPAIPARREHGHVGAEPVQGTVIEVPGKDAPTGAVVVHEEVERDVFDEEFRVVAQALLVERVQDGVTGAIRRGAGSLGRAFAEVGRHSAERALVDPPVLGAREGDPEVFELDDGGDRLAAHVLDRVLIAEPVRPLHRVVHVPPPVVLAHVAERGAHAALGRHRVAAGRKELGHAGGCDPFGGETERRAQACPARADDDGIVFVVDDGVGLGHSFNSPERFGAR